MRLFQTRVEGELYATIKNRTQIRANECTFQIPNLIKHHLIVSEIKQRGTAPSAPPQKKFIHE